MFGAHDPYLFVDRQVHTHTERGEQSAASKAKQSSRQRQPPHNHHHIPRGSRARTVCHCVRAYRTCVRGLPKKAMAALPNDQRAAAAAAAAEFAERVRTTEEESFYMDTLSWRGAESWSEAEIRSVSDAARSNTAIRSLIIDLARLTTTREISEANAGARILRHFPHLRALTIYDGHRHNDDDTPPAARLVDAFLREITASRSKIVKLQFYFCCSPDAFRDFVERFPNRERLDIEGQGDTDRSKSPAYGDFASAVECAIRTGKLSSLRHLGLDNSVGTASLVGILSAARLSSRRSKRSVSP